MAISRLDRVSVGAERHSEIGMGCEQGIRAIGFHGVSHWRGAEGTDDSRMTGCASRSWLLIGARLCGYRQRSEDAKQPN